jgi:hypothetical protein
MSELLSEIISGLGKYITLWYLAGFIATLFSILVILLSGGFVETVSGLMITAVIESLPFPINLLAGWQINPVSFIIELIFQTIICVVLVFLLKGRSGD